MDRRNCYIQLQWKFLSSFSNTRKWIPFSLPSPLNSMPLLWSQLGEPRGGQNPACYQHCLPSPLLISNKCQDLSIWSPKPLSSPDTSPPPLADLGLHHYACRLEHSANWFFWALLCWLWFIPRDACRRGMWNCSSASVPPLPKMYLGINSPLLDTGCKVTTHLSDLIYSSHWSFLLFLKYISFLNILLFTQ